jgi:hypothetical protein
MEILAVCQRVAKSVGIQVPEAVMASDARTSQELAALANQMAERIDNEHDWQRTRRLATITGDGATQAWDTPADYSRMPTATALQSSSGFLCNVVDHNLWLDWQLRGWSPGAPGSWTMLGDKVEILPVLGSGEVVKYWYQSDKIVRSDGTAANSSFPYSLSFELADSDAYGYAQDQFLTDSDHYQHDWRLLELGMIWQWRANKGMPYAEDMATYETRKARVMMKERGPRMVRVGGSSYWSDDADIAWPWTLRAS